MGDSMLALAERGLEKRRKDEVYQAKVAAGTVINKAIDERLKVWGEWHLGQRDGGAGGCSSMLAALIENQGEMIRCTAKGVDMSDYIYDTDRAVNQIEPEYRQVVRLQYVDLNKTPEERGAAIGCSKKTFYRKLAQAHHQVLFMPKRKGRGGSPVRDAMTKKSTV